MKISPQERMLQKCVDGELSPAERCAFLKTLNESGSLDGWRTLALSFVENQVFSQSFPLEDSSSAARSASQPAGQAPYYRRQVRPWVSVAASLLVGAMVGVGGHFWMKPGTGPEQSLATDTFLGGSIVAHPPLLASENHPVGGASVNVGPQMMHPSGGAPTPVMNVSLGRGSGGTQPISVPVFSPEQWQTMPKAASQASVPEEVEKLLEREGLQLDRERHWYRARLDDGREILVPAETVRVRQAIQ